MSWSHYHGSRNNNSNNNNNNRNNQTTTNDLCPPGESGPRRTTPSLLLSPLAAASRFTSTSTTITSNTPPQQRPVVSSSSRLPHTLLALDHEPMDTAAANAEAARLARQLGVASSSDASSAPRAGVASQMTRHQYPALHSNGGNGGGTVWPFRGGSNNRSNTATTSRGGTGTTGVEGGTPLTSSLMSPPHTIGSVRTPPPSATATTAHTYYTRMHDDSTGGTGTTTNSSNNSNPSSSILLDMRSNHSSSNNSGAGGAAAGGSCPSPSKQTNSLLAPEEDFPDHTNMGSGDATLALERHAHHATAAATPYEVHVYDAHGQRVPYKEGPYFVSREKDGRVVRKRWCTSKFTCVCVCVYMCRLVFVCFVGVGISME